MTGVFGGLAIASLALALLPLFLGLINLVVYRSPRRGPPPDAAVSVLIPARNEAANIQAAVNAALANKDIEIEVIVLDDESTDETAHIVAAIAARDPRLCLRRAPPLPRGWVGKAHACQALSGLACHPILLFVDADVKLAPDAIGRIVGFLTSRAAGLVSGFPRQETVSAGEALIVPLIHFVLIGYLPIWLMRRLRHPGLGAGCGQLLAVHRNAYEAAGGHAQVRATLHDGLMLPRAFRRAGFDTDLFDATDLASCRMYRNWDEVWEGFRKNAHEGMGTPRALPLWTILLGGGHVLPWLLLVYAAIMPPASIAITVAALAALAGVTFRLLLAWRFRQSPLAAALHPVGITVLLAIQWSALIQRWRGRRATWRGRAYPTW
jgi:glycosyltransferase involved in cell wall biosynthesis